ncbi:Hypothetical predicted protein [Pelobates cultripes]|uniref:Uncharacterized protein n=1 Tax=Pelobates cultripes TaxID=61616 RepID=A0AAD1SBV5_PELCU|nr:Hypothetical predicted protein [Pelobates cultripes]
MCGVSQPAHRGGGSAHREGDLGGRTQILSRGGGNQTQRDCGGSGHSCPCAQCGGGPGVRLGVSVSVVQKNKKKCDPTPSASTGAQEHTGPRSAFPISERGRSRADTRTQVTSSRPPNIGQVAPKRPSVPTGPE